MTDTYYITTPIYYVNGAAHVGTATTTLIADSVARFHRLRGERVFFLTGTDENAQKVADAAQKAGQAPKDYVDQVSRKFSEAWTFLNVSNDRFIRTTDLDHKAAVEEMFTRLQASGDIYKGFYEGWYSVADETFYRDSEVENGFAKETGSVVERTTEENYYFRLSAYSDRLLAHIEANPDFLMPATRRNEVVAFIKEGLRDIPFSRRNNGWGIPVPGDPTQVVYVWPDALVNYLAAAVWPDKAGWDGIWPPAAHLVGKEIYTRFHATLWPAMLMGLCLPLPQHVIGHGWWLVGGEKGSKSKGNMPTPQEAVEFLVERSGAAHAIAVDALRYYLLRDIAFSSDVEMSYENLVTRYNGELANNIGNLLNRSLNMLAQYAGSVVPDAAAQTSDCEVATEAKSTALTVEREVLRYNPGGALEAIARFADVNNKAIGTAQPWKKNKEGDTAAVAQALYTALEGNRILSVLLAPFLPATSAAIRDQLGIPDTVPAKWSDASAWGLLPAGSTTSGGEPLFPRIDTKVRPEAQAPQALPAQSSTSGPDKPQADGSATITIEDFKKAQLKVAQIKTAERIEGAKKLLRLTVDVGEAEPRQLVAGIAESYEPQELQGKRIVVVANLQPATIRGVTSHGMLLAATDSEGRAILLTPDKESALPGSKVK